MKLAYLVSTEGELVAQAEVDHNDRASFEVPRCNDGVLVNHVYVLDETGYCFEQRIPLSVAGAVRTVEVATVLHLYRDLDVQDMELTLIDPNIRFAEGF